ncbi:MAG: hypothetical protein ACR2FH_00945 [Caulobacteraceae bacterium]
MSARTLVWVSLAAAVALPLCAQAQDFTPTGDRILSDPTYLPLKGQFFGDSSYGYERGDIDIFDDTGTLSQSNRRTLNTVRQSFAYGVTDALSINAGIGYGFSGHNRQNTPDGVFTTNQSGWEDPTFGATFRLLDQRTHPVSLDVMGEYSPDAFQSRFASPTRDGTIARGGSEADFGVGLGHQTRFFTLRGVFFDRYFDNSSTFNPNTGGTSITRSYWVPTVGLETQTRFTDRLSANVGADYNFNGSPKVINGAGVEHTANLGDYQTVNVSLNYHFIPNVLVGSVNYHHIFQDRSNEVFADPAMDFSRQRSADGVGAELRYVFK